MFSHCFKISFLTGFGFVLFFAYFLFVRFTIKISKKGGEVVNIYYVSTMCLAP